jgi:hypothetical protein
MPDSKANPSLVPTRLSMLTESDGPSWRVHSNGGIRGSVIETMTKSPAREAMSISTKAHTWVFTGETSGGGISTRVSDEGVISSRFGGSVCGSSDRASYMIRRE